MKKIFIPLFFLFTLFLVQCKKDKLDPDLNDERVRQVILKHNDIIVGTYVFYYDTNKELQYYIFNGTDTISALKRDALYQATNLDMATISYLPLFEISNGLVVLKNGTRWVGAGFDLYYYRKDSGAIHYNSAQYMTFYENYMATDSTGCDPIPSVFNISYSNNNYTSLTGLWGYFQCNSSVHYWLRPDLQFSYDNESNSLGYSNFGITMFGNSNTNNIDSIYGSMQVDQDGAFYAIYDNPVNYKVNNLLDTKGRTIKTNFLPYDFTMGNLLYSSHNLCFFASYNVFDNNNEYEISYY